MPDKQTPPENGIKTDDANIIVCQCGHVVFSLDKRTATSVKLKCKKCGTTLSVKGAVAPVRIHANDIAYAVTEKVVRPDPDSGKKPPTTPGSKTLGEQGYRTLRFKLSQSQDDVVQRAMEIVRIMNCKDEAYKNKQWQGTALEQICADFLSGADPRAIAIQSNIEDEVQKAKAEALVKDKKTKLTKRKIRKIRTDARERLYNQYGLDDEEGSEEYVPPPLSESEVQSDTDYEESKRAAAEEEAEDTRLIDDEKLYQSVGACMIEFGEEYEEEHGKRPDMLIGKPTELPMLNTSYESSGGSLYKILGDVKTKTKAGQQPEMFVWIGEGLDLPDLGLAYEEAFEGEAIGSIELTVERVK